MTPGLHPANELADLIDLLVNAEASAAFSIGRWTMDEGEQDRRRHLREKCNEYRGRVAAILDDWRKGRLDA